MNRVFHTNNIFNRSFNDVVTYMDAFLCGRRGYQSLVHVSSLYFSVVFGEGGCRDFQWDLRIYGNPLTIFTPTVSVEHFKWVSKPGPETYKSARCGVWFSIRPALTQKYIAFMTISVSRPNAIIRWDSSVWQHYKSGHLDQATHRHSTIYPGILTLWGNQHKNPFMNKKNSKWRIRSSIYRITQAYFT